MLKITIQTKMNVNAPLLDQQNPNRHHLKINTHRSLSMIEHSRRYKPEANNLNHLSQSTLFPFRLTTSTHCFLSLLLFLSSLFYSTLSSLNHLSLSTFRTSIYYLILSDSVLIANTINRFKRYTDKIRASPPVFNPGDMVWLSSKNIKSTRHTKKLSEIWLGPFPILKKVSTHAYHLNGNPSTQYSIFHSWNQSRHQQSRIGIKSLLLQSSLKKRRNGKSLKYWIQSSREESYGFGGMERSQSRLRKIHMGTS
ncbi:hypothetical protein O181_039838 [Austropuccinia psidii MF-1]|uniref:Tf2-1-like SH3-like domain-containing protein n=1 Tax=Austropuccinia psidii MF-1 TaxID=1389203 RepID=A0A9Q3HCB7_9BASI|nr:hypothetical protein [Austropuccinia psidii MF-1]